MTKREIYEAIINNATITLQDTEVTVEDIIALAEKELETLDKRNAKARERAEQKRKDSDELGEFIYNEILTNDFQPIAAILTQINSEEPLSASKIVARMKKLIEAGKVEKSEIKVNTDDGKTKSVMGYKRV